jgi:hypothetical protein
VAAAHGISGQQFSCTALSRAARSQSPPIRTACMEGGVRCAVFSARGANQPAAMSDVRWDRDLVAGRWSCWSCSVVHSPVLCVYLLFAIWELGAVGVASLASPG